MKLNFAFLLLGAVTATTIGEFLLPPDFNGTVGVLQKPTEEQTSDSTTEEQESESTTSTSEEEGATLRKNQFLGTPPV